MATLVMIDGRILDPEDAKVSVFDRGFLYGDAVFETIRTYGGVPFALDQHLERLSESAARVYIELPVPIETLRGEVLKIVEAAGNAEAFIRIMITRGCGETLGLDPGLAKNPMYVVIAMPLEPPPASFYEQGIKTATYRTQRFADEADATGAKLVNYLISVLAMREARKVGAAEALIVDRGGQVLEGSTSNVFLLEGGRLVTPPGSAGILLGITRRYLLEVAREAGLAVEEQTISVERLLRADELVITSSIREIVPVVAVDGKTIGSGAVGPVARDLLRRFREKVRKSVGL
jgi:branched-chain amino acid aminotransferase